MSRQSSCPAPPPAPPIVLSCSSVRGFLKTVVARDFISTIHPFSSCYVGDGGGYKTIEEAHVSLSSFFPSSFTRSIQPSDHRSVLQWAPFRARLTISSAPQPSNQPASLGYSSIVVWRYFELIMLGENEIRQKAFKIKGFRSSAALQSLIGPPPPPPPPPRPHRMHREIGGMMDGIFGKQ